MRTITISEGIPLTASEEVIRQYEYENFILAYEAYRALGGNSFMEKIHDEVRTWEVVT